MVKKTLSFAPQSKIWMLPILLLVGISLLSFASAWWIGATPSAYWKFNEASGNALDSSGNGLTLTNSGGATFTAGKLNNAGSMTFDDSFTGVDDATYDFGTEDFTIAFWIKTAASDVDVAIVSDSSDWLTDGRWIIAMNNGVAGSIRLVGGGAVFTANATLNDNAWHRVVFVRDGIGAGQSYVYVDGALNNTATTNKNFNSGDTFKINGGSGAGFTGLIDDVQIFKGYAWSSAYVVFDYNSGAGMEADGGTADTTVILTSPADSTTTTSDSFIFTGNITPPLNYNLTNATLYIWSTNNTLVNRTTQILSGDVLNISSINATFPTGSFLWNYYGCSINISGNSQCTFATANRSFTKTVFSIISQAFTSSVYETSRQSFEMNISTISSVLSVNSKLIYNGTNYSASSNCVSGICVIKSNIDIPLIPYGNQQNKSFYWELKVYDGTTSNTVDTLSNKQEQNVTAINLTICSATYNIKALNFTAFDEQNLTRIPIFDYAGTFDFWLGGGSVKKSYTYYNTAAREVDFCIQPNQTFYLDGNVRYNFKDVNLTFNTKSYYFQNFSLNSILNHIELYLFNTGSSTPFILQVLKNNAGVASALINVQRYYPEFGFWKTVQIARTDANGESIGYYEVETVDYRHIIYGSDGSLLLTTTSQKVVGKSAPFTLIFDVGEAPGTPWSGFLNQTNYTTSLLWNVTNKMVTFNYIDLSGNALRGRLIVELEKYSNKSIVICNVTSIISAAILTCNLSAYTSGTFIAKGYVETAAETKLLDLINFVISTANSILDYSSVIMGWFIILTVALAFFWNPSVDIIAINIAVIFVNIIGLVTFSPVWIFGMIAMSVILLILMRT